MINCLGIYLTRSGEVVEITRILESQPIAEGYLLNGGFRKSFLIWNVDGSFNRLKQTDHDIVRFCYSNKSDESYD